MPVRIATLFFALITSLVVPPTLEAAPAPIETSLEQEATTTSGRVRVYLDCFDCFQTFLREQIDFVDFVREAQDADVHLLSSGRGTGGGGREVILRFVGRNRFAGHDHDLRAVTTVGDTENVRREVILRTVIVGLLDYLAHDGIPPGVTLSIATEPRDADETPGHDVWNLWVFSVGGNGSIDMDERNREREWTVNFNADRVTSAWKTSFGGRFEHNVERFELDDDEPFEVTRRERNLNWFVAKSYGPHWSVGFRGRAAASTFGNEAFSGRLAPAIEYSIFPYEDYATRQLRIEYDLGIERARYNEVTVFGKLKETLWRHEISARLDQRQPWGSLRAGLEFSQYLHDTSKNRIEGDGNISLRILRGLSVNVNGSASRVRDQLSLPQRGATPEEILLRLRQLQSGYEMNLRVGVTYSFGSIFNNVVNPRFGN